MSHSSTGGIASADFQLDEFERAAVFLDRARGHLTSALGLLSASLADVARVLVSESTLVSLSAELHFRSGHDLGARALQEAEECLRGLQESRRIYESVELRSTRRANAARGEAVLWALLRDLRANHGRPRGQTTEDLVNAAPQFVADALVLGGPPLFPARQGLRFLVDRPHGGRFSSGIADRGYPALAGIAAQLQAVRLGPVRVLSISTGTPEPFSGTLPDLMELQRRAEAGVSGEGAILVTSAHTPHGTIHAAAVNPFDEGGIVEGAGLGSRYVGDAVLEALRDAGAGPGDRLVLTGYSQGGIHAANLAVDPRIAGTYDVEYVVTSGSPVGNVPLPDAVRGLHLEHADDMVPGLDGMPNPASSNQVTVRFDGYAPNTDRNAEGFGAAHQLDNYTHVSGELATSGDPSVVEAKAALGGVFAGATVATVATVKLRRDPGPRKTAVRTKPVPSATDHRRGRSIR